MLVTHIKPLLPLLLSALCCNLLLLASLLPAAAVAAAAGSQGGARSGVRFEPDTNSYSGLTFTFDPRLDKRVEWLHFDHWLAIMQHSSALLYGSLNGRAHLAEVRVLIPYKWRQAEWPVLHKPGVPIIMNRRLQYADSDVIVGFDDPIYKETPFAIQHDECSKQGLNIHMPISFLEQNQHLPLLDTKLKARLLVREFASHRYGVFKESGFRSDYMYPPFSSLAGYSRQPTSAATLSRQQQYTATNGTRAQQHQQLQMQQLQMLSADGSASASGFNQSQQDLLAASIRGYDENWNECSFDTSPANGLPLPQALNCAPYLTTRATSSSLASSSPQQQISGASSSSLGDAPLSFNLMSSDPFAYSDLGPRLTAARIANQPLPVEWRQLADSVKWHFCGENFAPSSSSSVGGAAANVAAISNSNNNNNNNNNNGEQVPRDGSNQFAHNQLASNKQNVMCNERSAMNVIKSHEDFRRTSFSPSTFNRLPATNFKFLQEMPPRLILCVEYSGHLYQSRRLEHGILEAAVGKFLAYDLIADTEMALILFGQQHSTRTPFKRLDSSVDSRLTLYSPPLDPYDEQARFYTEQELLQLDLQPATASQATKLIKGTCSLAKALAEAGASLQQRSHQYDDVGSDLILLTSGLFVEDEQKIEELLRSGGWTKNDQLQLNLIIYPAGMLFDTRSGRDGSVALDSIESESIIRNRINKLLLIQRLMPSARLHLVREHLDANGNVKMSTLLQFYQIFEHLSRGHSWDQTHSMNLLAQQTVETPRNHNYNHNHQHHLHHHHQAAPASTSGSSFVPNNGTKLSFQFQLDASIQNELIVGFLDPKQHQLTRSGKRFALKNLQLRSPGGHMLLTDSHPWCVMNSSPPQQYNQLVLSEQQPTLVAGSQDQPSASLQEQQQQLEQLDSQEQLDQTKAAPSAESALFPYRTQLSLAGFHLRASHLAQLNETHRLTGTWTLTATSDEPIQTDALAMARVNSAGDTITARCWIQTYHGHQQQHSQDMAGGGGGASAEASSQQPQRPLKAVKVFLQTKAGARMGPVQELDARMEVQDELGNIVQNVNMLDDGLGAPDMTRGDGIHSQYVMRAHRSGFYRVSVELTGPNSFNRPTTMTTSNSQMPQPQAGGSSSSSSRGHGQDGACCGSTVPSPPKHLAPDTRFLNRQLYCGTFYAESGNRLAQQRPPRVNNITVVNVDQENRRVTIRWLEPSVDISSSSSSGPQQSNRLLVSENELPPVQELDATSTLQGQEPPQALVSSAAGSVTRISRPIRRHSPPLSTEEEDSEEQQSVGEAQQSEMLAFELQAGRQPSDSGAPRGLILAGNHPAPSNQPALTLQAGANRYEIKLFTDRDMLKRAFDAKQEVGFRFTEWNVEGPFPNASAYGGSKEVTLKIPYGREGVYYIAMKVYNNLGIGSHLSHIVQFWLRNNLTLEEAESIYGQSGGTIDAEGNVYDKNGELIHQRSQANGGAGAGSGVGQLSYLLPRRPGGGLDGISVLVLISVLAFVFSVVCISLVACLASSARRSLAKRDPADDKKAVTGGSSMGLGAGSGSSMGSSGCESSQQSEVASSAGSSHCGGHDVEITNKLSMVGDELTYTNSPNTNNTTTLLQQHQHQQHQAQLIESQMMMAAAHQNHHQEDPFSSTNHTSYQQQQHPRQQQYSDAIYQQHLNQFSEQVGGELAGKPAKQQQQWLQHTMVNGYAYATVNGGQLALGANGNGPASMAEGDLNQNGLGGVGTMSPVQSWPADILLSHYDKVKQARERNEAPPVMRIETLEHQNQFSDPHVGLPNMEQQQQQDSPNEQNYLVRQQRNQMPSYFNLQLQQQLSSVLKSKQHRNHHHSHHHQPMMEPMDEESSPALEGVRDLHDNQDGYQMDQHHIAPPPQYVYCAPATAAAGLPPPAPDQGLMVGGNQQI